MSPESNGVAVSEPEHMEAAVQQAVAPAAPSTLPIGTAEDILNAPSDLVEEVVEVPEWGFSVRIRSLTAAQSSQVVQAASDVKAGGLNGTFAETIAKTQFLHGVVEPKFSAQQVNVLHHRSGPGFARVIAALDRISGTGKQSLETAEASFPQSSD